MRLPMWLQQQYFCGCWIYAAFIYFSFISSINIGMHINFLQNFPRSLNNFSFFAFLFRVESYLSSLKEHIYLYNIFLHLLSSARHAGIFFSYFIDIIPFFLLHYLANSYFLLFDKFAYVINMRRGRETEPRKLTICVITQCHSKANKFVWAQFYGAGIGLWWCTST